MGAQDPKLEQTRVAKSEQDVGIEPAAPPPALPAVFPPPPPPALPAGLTPVVPCSAFPASDDEPAAARSPRSDEPEPPQATWSSPTLTTESQVLGRAITCCSVAAAHLRRFVLGRGDAALSERRNTIG